MSLPRASAQTDRRAVRDAIDILKGKSDANTPSWAVEVLGNVSDPTDVSLAKNALGMAYLTGVVLKADTLKALSLLEEAAALGNDRACHNLGVYYKTLPRGRQNFQRAFAYFMKGAESGRALCGYDVGYMRYKGLGCSQDYKEAVRYFSMDMVHSPSSMYMLGLCYRNGFGVEQDPAKARELLDRASSANYRSAIEEELREAPEVMESQSLQEETDEAIPEVMPEVEAMLGAEPDLAGRYAGRLVTYDWSGKNIVREQSLNMSFGKAGEDYTGLLMLEHDTIPFVARMNGRGELDFRHTALSMPDRYVEGHMAAYLLEKASLVSLGNHLTGALRFYSLTMGEPDRPMYLSLTKSDRQGSRDQWYCDLQAFPVGDGQIEVRFLLPSDVKTSSVRLYAKSGLLMRRFNTGPLQAGKHSVTINAATLNDTYIVTMQAADYHGQTLIYIK
jgi:hypothetical protein